jgi:hypothetical protein
MTNHTPDTAALRERLDFIGIDDATRDRLRSLKEVIAASIDGALDEFYARVRVTPQLAAMFSNEKHLESAKKRQEKHWNIIASADFDNRYVEGVSVVGQVHARLGLEPRWYIGGYALILEQLIASVVKARWPSAFGRKHAAELARDVSTVVKAAMLDMDYGVSIYLDELAAARRKTEEDKARAEADQRAALQLLASALDALAAGDLESRLTSELPVEFAEMATNFDLDRHRRRRHRQRLRRPVAPHRTAGGEPRGKLGCAAPAFRKRAADRRQCRQGVRRGRRDPGRGRPVGKGGCRHRRGDEQDQVVVGGNRGDHRRHRRDRLPDQPAGAQCRCRGGARRRRGTRLRRGGAGGAQPRPALRRLG